MLGHTTGTEAWFCGFVPTLCRESIPALRFGTLASEICRHSHVFDAKPLAAVPRGRAVTLPAVRPGVQSHTRSPSAPLRPAPGASLTWPEPEVASAGQASSCWGHPRAGLRRSPLTHQDERHELVPLLFRLSTCCLQTLSQRPEASFYKPIAPRVVRGGPCIVYSKQPAHLQYHF